MSGPLSSFYDSSVSEQIKWLV